MQAPRSGRVPSALAALGLCIPFVASAQDEGERVSELLTRGAGVTEAVQLLENVYVAVGNANVYRVVTPEGSVIIDTGLGIQAKRQHAQLMKAHAGSPAKYVILTHSHPDHVGGLRLWRQPGVTVIGHRALAGRNADHRRLEKFRDRRARVLWAAVMPVLGSPVPDAHPDIVVDRRHDFELGGVRFQVLATPGAEGPDAVSVWVPKYRALFIGDVLGPTIGSFPNLFTLRGENLREAVPMIESINGLRGLSPDILLPGHFEPLRGRQEIRSILKQTAEAVRYVHNKTVAGMNEGKDLWTLMREIELPPHLQVSQQYGRVAWGVRAIWESYTGWFRYESTTELYAHPPASIYAELAEMVGASALVQRANAHTQAGEPEKALHFVEVALAAEPDRTGALKARLGALRALAARDGKGNFQLGGWLRERIARTEAALAQ